MLKNIMLAAVTFITAAMVGTAVYAADKVNAELSEAYAVEDGEYTVYLSLDNVPQNGISGIDLAVEYDSTMLSVDSVESLVKDKTDTSNVMFDTYNKNGRVNICWMVDSDRTLSGPGKVFAISGKVLSGVSAGSETKLEVVPVSRTIYDGSSAVNDGIFIGYSVNDDEVCYDVSSTAGRVMVTANGDVNVDGVVDEEDVAIVLKHTAKDEEITTPYFKKAADCAEGFGKIDLKDAIWIINNLKYGGTALDISKSNINPTTYSDGVLNAENIEMFSIPLGRTLYEGESVKVYVRARDNGATGFRSWLTDDGTGTCSNQEGIFEPQKDGGKYVYTLTVKKGSPANAIMFKGPVYGVYIKDLDILYVGVEYGVPAETSEATTESTTEATTSSQSTGGEHSHNFDDGIEDDFFNISGNLSTGKGSVTYNGHTIEQCLKIESATKIKFTLSGSGKLTMVFKDEGSSCKIKVDGVSYDIPGGGVYTMDLSAGEHTVQKGSGSPNLFYISVK